MKITVLTENTTRKKNLVAEHGLSLYIETEKYKILFDMGQTDAFALNAEKLGVDLEAVDFAVLSHGHYDHGGGIEKFLEINPKAKIYLNENAFGNHFNGIGKYIGLDKKLQGCERLVFISDEFEIEEGINLFSCNKLAKKHPINPYGLGIDRGNGVEPDDFLHEQYLLINEGGRKFLFSGCSHKGVLNIAQWFSPDFFIGGFHLSKLDTQTDERETLDEIAHILMESDAEYYTAHCTGTEQFAYLESIMGGRLNYLSTGLVQIV